MNIRLTSKNLMYLIIVVCFLLGISPASEDYYLIIILHFRHTCMSISIYVGLSHHSFFLLYTVFVH
jgi:hypothetical protein